MKVQRAIACTALLVSACASAAPRPDGAASPPPSSAHALFERGRELAARGDASRAQQYFELSIRAGYPESRAIVPLVQVCVATFRLRAALGHARGYLKRNPTAFRLRYLVAAIDAALGQNAAAASELRRVVAQQPDATQAHYLLGVIERDVFHDEAAARSSFGAYLEHEADGAFSAEVRAWLAEHPAAAPDAASTRLESARVRAAEELRP